MQNQYTGVLFLIIPATHGDDIYRMAAAFDEYSVHDLGKMWSDILECLDAESQDDARVKEKVAFAVPTSFAVSSERLH
jgi:hypothetical protein